MALPRTCTFGAAFAEAGVMLSPPGTGSERWGPTRLLCSARRVPGSERGTAASLATRLGFALAGQPHSLDGGDEGGLR